MKIWHKVVLLAPALSTESGVKGIFSVFFFFISYFTLNKNNILHLSLIFNYGSAQKHTLLLCEVTHHLRHYAVLLSNQFNIMLSICTLQLNYMNNNYNVKLVSVLKSLNSYKCQNNINDRYRCKVHRSFIRPS